MRECFTEALDQEASPCRVHKAELRCFLGGMCWEGAHPVTLLNTAQLRCCVLAAAQAALPTTTHRCNTWSP